VSRRLLYLLPIVVGALMMATALLSLPQAQAAAQCGGPHGVPCQACPVGQCGSQASSCKNCHEVQGKKPVNGDGTGWHTGHAFGDFCANCHAGNVQATDETAAHAGMVAPLSDIKANCAACHPNDTETRAQKYATILGVSLSTGGNSTSGGGTTTTGSTSAPATPATVATPAPAPTTAVAASSDNVPGLIDYNLQYAETVQGRWPINWGNVIVGGLIVLVGGGGGTFAFYNERKLRRLGKAVAAQPSGSLPSAEPAATAADSPVKAVDLLPQLEKLDPRSLRALKQILREPEMANGLLLTLARLDPRLIEEVRRLDRRELNLLLALAEEK
jgi:hypothetical protein